MSKTILIVDDSRISRMLIRAVVVEAKPDWTVIEAESSEAALNKVKGVSFDVATLDLNMPGIDGIDGIELAKALKQQFPNADYTLLTANIQDVIKERAKAVGIGFMEKPITEEKVLAFISPL